MSERDEKLAEFLEMEKKIGPFISSFTKKVEEDIENPDESSKATLLGFSKWIIESAYREIMIDTLVDSIVEEEDLFEEIAERCLDSAILAAILIEESKQK